MLFPPNPPLTSRQPLPSPLVTPHQRGRSPSPHYTHHSSNQRFNPSTPSLSRHKSQYRSHNITCRRCNLNLHFATDC